jgi:hypothetical protein
MHAITIPPSWRWTLALAVVACSRDDAPAADSLAVSPSGSPSVAATPSVDSSAASRAATGTSTPVVPPTKPRIADSHANIPTCRRPVAVTYYARGGVPEEFIVTFGGMNGAPADAVIDSLAQRHGFTATHRYQGAFSGFSARLSAAALVALRCEPAVTRISQVVIGNVGAPPPDAAMPGADR